MQWFILILLSAGVFALIWYIQKRQKTQLTSKGRYIERGSAFYKQSHCFYTRTDNFNAIIGSIDQNALFEEKISFEPDVGQGRIIFQNMVSFGTFIASLSYSGRREQDNLNTFIFQIESWRDGQYGITRQDLFGANILLTLIEKAFLSLDPATEVERAAAQYKSKFF